MTPDGGPGRNRTTMKSRKAQEYFNRHIDADMIAVLDASAVLEITEFKFFELAYRDWHGHKATEQLIEKYFAAYMFAERIPSWVRSFARKVLKLHRQGRLDPRSFGVWRRLPSTRMILFAKAYTALLFLIFVGLMLSTYSVSEEILQIFRQCYLPPCY